ncbi:chemotaxis protein CheB [Pseudonocardia sp. RS010]|uniref:chemotaxis protein CheB n=1 Tax=Pseudonocardia sp. RS010 TaxID=3385979 RepID=UPI0039A32B42
MTAAASLGGLGALTVLLRGLPGDFPAPVVVVQHGRRSPDEDRLATLLRRESALPVRTAVPGPPAPPEAGITVVPGGYHGVFDEAGRLGLVEDPTPRGGDALMTSAARAFRGGLIGIVLTGMLDDGAAGVRMVKRYGGRVLVQDPATARAPGMPSQAIGTGCVDFVLPVERIAPALVALTMAPGGAELLSVPTAPWARLPA